LAASLPYPQNLAGHVDKASIMRLSITYLKLKSFVDSAVAVSSNDPTLGSFLLGSKGLDHSAALVGLLFVVSKDGEIIFVSDNVTDQLGLQQASFG
jgi:hypoxia-inducible factor 1 alpha